MPISPAKTLGIALAVVPESAAGVLYSLHEVFSFVGTIWEALTGRPAGGVRMAPRLVAEAPGLMTCRLGAPVPAAAGFGGAARYDIVIASDLALEPGFDPRGKWGAAAAGGRTADQKLRERA